MVGWGKLLIPIFCVLVCSIKAQVLDTTNGNIYIHFTNKSTTDYVVDIAKVKCGYSNIKVKDNLGSYHVKFDKVASLKKYTVIKKTEQSVVWKNGANEIQLLLTSENDTHFKLQFSSNQDINHWEFSVERLINEQPLGGGIQFSEYTNYNKKWINLSQENGIGRGGGSISKWTKLAGVAGENYATYATSPRFFTTQNRFFEWNEFAYSEVTFSNDAIAFTVLDDSVNLTLGFAQKEGNAPLSYDLPDWSLGTILGLQGGSQEVLDKVSKVIHSGSHIDAVWIQDWVGKRATKFGSRLNWTWELDTVHYPHFSEFRDQLEQQNIKLLGYVNPFFAEEGNYIIEGLQKGFFVKDANNKSIVFNYGGMDGYMLDIFNESAYQWMKQIIQTNLVESGFSGWMADFAEWYPVNVDHDIALGLKKHNEYPVLWAKLNYEVIQESGKELFFFNRSGGMQTAKYSSMMWAGDQMVDETPEDGLLSVFDAYLSSAHSGFPILHSDAGGYTSVKKPIIKNILRDEKLLKNWLLLETFTPVLRTHEGLLPEDNIQVYSDTSMAHHFGKLSKIHHDLKPYFQSVIEERVKNGSSVFTNFNNNSNWFYVGKSILIGHSYNQDENMDWKDWIFLDSDLNVSESPNNTSLIFVGIKKGSDVYEVVKP